MREHETIICWKSATDSLDVHVKQINKNKTLFVDDQFNCFPQMYIKHDPITMHFDCDTINCHCTVIIVNFKN